MLSLMFDEETGYLPKGIHEMNWQAVVDLCGFNPHRRNQLAGLRRAILALKQAGCRTVYLDGSFATSKEKPGDYDAAYEMSGIDEQALLKIAPKLFEFSNGRAEMKAEYEGELFASDWDAAAGVPFLDFFQHDRDGNPKGLIKIATRSVT